MPLPNLNRKEIVAEIFNQTGYNQKEVQDVVELTLDTIVKALTQGRSVELRRFGVFALQKRKPRIGRNPKQPDQQVPIPARAVVKFKIGKELQEGLRKLNPAVLD
ncbi:MAG: integration host factor subunit beta [Puniceicoccales bacterium]|nr:integration host factor subunit beta [Puniceicoccales bacterium]